MSKTDMLCTVLHFSGVLSLKARAVRERGWPYLTILAYHRVLRGKAEGGQVSGFRFQPSSLVFDEGVISATADAFERQMKFVKENFNVIGFGEIDELTVPRCDQERNGGGPPSPDRGRPARGHGVGRPGRAPLIITFDDGYKDNHDVALPILEKHGLKATFFITTGYIATGAVPWWYEIAWMAKRGKGRGARGKGEKEMKSGSAGASPSHWLHGAGGRASRRAEPGVFQLLAKAKALSQEGLAAMMGELRSEYGRCPSEVAADLFMSWSDIRELASAGMEIGSHTVTHPILGLVNDPAVLRRELGDSKRVLEEKTGEPIKVLSYPVGGQKGNWSRVTEMTKEIGYQYACLYTSDRNHIPIGDWYNLSRIRVEAGDSFARFRAKVLFPGVVKY